MMEIIKIHVRISSKDKEVNIGFLELGITKTEWDLLNSFEKQSAIKQYIETIPGPDWEYNGYHVEQKEQSEYKYSK